VLPTLRVKRDWAICAAVPWRWFPRGGPMRAPRRRAARAGRHRGVGRRAADRTQRPWSP